MTSRSKIKKILSQKNFPENFVFWLILLLLFIFPFLKGGTDFLAQAVMLCLPLPLLLLLKASGKIKRRVLPEKISFFGVAFLFFVLMSVVASVSLALSLPAFFQLLAFYLFFYLFWITSSKDNFKKGIWAIFAASFLLCLLSFYYLLPQVAEKPDGTNLVYATFGHSHLADYLLLVIPIVLASFLNERKRKPKLLLGSLLGFFLLNFVLTFSRGAFLVLPAVVLFLIFFSTKPKGTRENIITWLVVLLPLFLILLILVCSFLSGVKIPFLFSDDWLVRQLVKPTFTAKRLEYWHQALRGFSTRPLFGFGWGTFKLVALRFQRLPVSWSDYAHNFYLQVLAEAGIFAFLGFLGFLSSCFLRIWQMIEKKKDPILLGVFGAILASSFHSLVDYDWNFPAVFLTFLFLLASLLALSCPMSDQKKRPLAINPLILIAFFCFIFGQMQMMGEFFYKKGSFEKAFFFSPWREKVVVNAKVAFLAKDLKSQKRLIRSLLFLYGDEPNVLSFLQEKFYPREISEVVASLYYRTITASPLENFKLYPKLASIYDKLKKEKEKEELDKFFSQHLDQERNFFQNKPGYAKIFYLFGETYLGKEEEKALPWWERAVEAGPKWSYFHIELASLYSKLGKERESKKVLDRCLSFIHPRKHCQMVLRKLETEKKISEPGSLRMKILEEVKD